MRSPSAIAAGELDDGLRPTDEKLASLSGSPAYLVSASQKSGRGYRFQTCRHEHCLEIRLEP